MVDDLANWSSSDADDPNGGTSGACWTNFNYARDSAGNLNFISTEIHCTENEKPTPEVKKRAFRWNLQALRFDELK